MHKFVVILTVVCVLSGCFPAPPQTVTAWDGLDLESTQIVDTAVYYEKSLESKLSVFEKEYSDFKAKRRQSTLTPATIDAITADVNRILGISDAGKLDQDRIMPSFLGMFSQAQLTFRLVTRQTVKDFLRAGGKLPDHSYDRNTDTATYCPQFSGGSQEGPVKQMDLTIPLASVETFEKDVSDYFEMLRTFLCAMTKEVAIHELAEMTLLNHVRPQGQYWRWFSDGFADAITYEILKKHFGAESADEFLKAYDSAQYADLKEELNLRYWTALNFCIKTPFESEDKLNYARYCYATLEAQGLIERHGTECVAAIVSELKASDSRRSDDILAAIKKATGEDMAPRLDKYQSFIDRKKGIAMYAIAFQKASNSGDTEQMLISLLRYLELLENPLSADSLKCRQNIAILLAKLGHEDAGDKAMLDFLDFLEKDAPEEAHRFFSAGFVVYALQTGKPEKAKTAADRLLQNDPNHPPALTVKMQLLAAEGKTEEAKKIANRICNIMDDKDSFYHAAAAQILEKEPEKE